ELGFTTAVGKSGTSSSWRDAWFVGFTGALVTGIWVGYDDFRPMPGITGGSLPAQAWHDYMTVAHKNYPDIPGIPGVSADVNRLAHQERPSELKRTEQGITPSQNAQSTQRSSSLMTDKTRDVLRRIAEGMRRAANSVAAVPATTAGLPGSGT